MIDISSLNEKQKEAVVTTDGPVLVLAGAGSGKTKALTFRIANIIDKKLANFDELLAVTFTNKAAGEMKERVMKIITDKNIKMIPYMGTFHSICVKILRIDGYRVGISDNYVIYDTDDCKNIVKDIFIKNNISTKEFNTSAIHSTISSLKNELITDMDYRSIAQGYFQEKVAEIYPEYQKELRANNAVDFDDLIMKVVELFENHKDILQKYQNRFKYIMVDEYQDTNKAQYKLIKYLAQKYENICVVGDEDQSIYKFRGSDISNILNFEKDFPKAKIIKLEQNYRSTQTILNAANGIIKANKERRDKKMWTANGEGERIVKYMAEDEKDEGKYITEIASDIVRINNINRNLGVDIETIAVLYRTNAQSRSIEENFIKSGISYKLVGGIKFYERREIKDLIAYLRVMGNPKDNISLQRIINTPKRGAGKKIMDELYEMTQKFRLSFGEILTVKSFINSENEENSDLSVDEIDDNAKKESKLTQKKTIISDSIILEIVQSASKDLQNLIALFSDIRSNSFTLNIKEYIKYILNKVNYIEYISDGSNEAEGRLENIKELLSVAENYNNLSPKESLKKFLEDLALIEQDNKKDKDKEVEVTLMTVHASKGLEFDHVFIAGMEESLFPHSRSLTDSSEMEEERRLAYVAVTRAKQKLHILHSESRLYFGARQANDASRFINDIPEAHIEMKFYDGGSGKNLKNSNKFSFSDDDFSDSDFEQKSNVNTSYVNTFGNLSSNIGKYPTKKKPVSKLAEYDNYFKDDLANYNVYKKSKKEDEWNGWN